MDNHLCDFLNGRLKIIVGTTALCAGVDCPDVRLVLHIGHPFSLTQWVQAAGRAGRDGSAACAQIVLHNDGQSHAAEE
ncbi:P-loop containing nucleoside triphosphate hydrolase protein, partial [Zopfochytrium polystomum]